MFRISFSVMALLAATVLPLSAQDIFNSGVTISDGDLSTADLFVQDNTVLDGSVCLGNGCIVNQTFEDTATLLMKHTTNGIAFVDTSSTTFPDRDWRILVNDVLNNASGGLERFAIKDDTADVIPFTIMGGAPANALYVAADGNIGLGTSVPEAPLHIVDGSHPTLSLEMDGSEGNTPTKYNVQVHSNQFALYDATNFALPFIVFSGAGNSGALAITGNGNVGFGTFSPDTMVHLQRSGGAQLKVEELSSTQTARPLLNLQNHGRPDIIMGNTATGGEWAFGAGNNFVLKTGAVGSTDAEKTLHLKLFGATGNLEITGQIITGGGTCGGGCDRVFTERAIIPQAEYRAAMWENGYLPHVGPTKEGAPINVSEKLGGMLNSLEHAHIYIGELEAKNASLEARLLAIEAKLAD